MYEPYVELAARLCRLVGDDRKAILFTTGAEAIENAVKIARAHTKRQAVVAFTGGFHGRTLLSLTMTSSSPAYRQNFGPFASEVYHSPFPDEYRGWTTDRAIDALQELFDTRVTPENVAAVVIEPQLGEGGFVPAPVAFLQRLRALTERFGIVFIADEVQTGFGRTGKMFGYQHAGIEPDLDRDGEEPRLRPPAVGGRRQDGDHGRAAARRPRRHLRRATRWRARPRWRSSTCSRARRSSRVPPSAASQVREALRRLQARVPAIGDVRGLGCMLAMEFVKDRDDERTRCGSGAARHRGGAKPRAAAAQVRAAQERGAAAAAADGDGGRAGEGCRDPGGGRARRGRIADQIAISSRCSSAVQAAGAGSCAGARRSTSGRRRRTASRSTHPLSRWASRSSPIDRTGRRSAPPEGPPRERRRVVVTQIPRGTGDVRSRCGADAGGPELVNGCFHYT